MGGEIIVFSYGGRGGEPTHRFPLHYLHSQKRRREEVGGGRKLKYMAAEALMGDEI